MWREAATILGAALPLVLYWAINTLRFKRFRQFANLPQPKSHLLWGHIRVMTEYMKLGPRDRHIDAVMHDVVRDLDGSPNGSGTGVVKGVPPPVAFLDFRPFTYPMLLVTSHEVAEQISRATRAWPYSMPKSPTMKHLIPLMGRQSIVTAQVSCITKKYTMALPDANAVRRVTGRGVEEAQKAIQLGLLATISHDAPPAYPRHDGTLHRPPGPIRGHWRDLLAQRAHD